MRQPKPSHLKGPPSGVWLGRFPLRGAGGGLVLALLVVTLGGGGVVFKTAAFVGIVSAGYFIGVAMAFRRRLADNVEYSGRIRAELRHCQDYIMETGSYRALGAFLEATAHHIKEPLAGLATDARSLAAESGLPETAGRVATRVQERAGAIANALGPLAAYTLTEPSRAPFNLNNLMREAIDLCRMRAEEKKIRFDERYGVVPPVFGPGSRVLGALLHIVVNAVEAMPFGGGVIAVETSHEGERVVCRVRDTGIGIRPEHLGKIFNPFFTTKPGHGGAGLGLWESHAVLDLIGATIDVKSAALQGTDVTMTFPIAAELSPGREGTAHPPEVMRNTADEKNRQIA